MTICPRPLKSCSKKEKKKKDKSQQNISTWDFFDKMLQIQGIYFVFLNIQEWKVYEIGILLKLTEVFDIFMCKRVHPFEYARFSLDYVKILQTGRL